MNLHSADNRDSKVVQAFGEEWARFSQQSLVASERAAIFADYFAIFPWSLLPEAPRGADIGCGSGRWAAVVADKVGHLACIDASPQALDVARRNLMGASNVDFHVADVGSLPFADAELDFAYSLGVLHHVPDTGRAIAEIVRCLKPGGIFLVYLYYALDNRPLWFRLMWRASNAARGLISRLPSRLRFPICDLIAAGVYWPLAKFSALQEKTGMSVAHLPLSYYRDKSFYVMRTDALDRFGTRLEKRFSRNEITAMLKDCGLTDIAFSPRAPHWCAVARKA